MRPELQLILASAVLHPAEAELQAIDALIPTIEDWNKLALLLIDRGTAPLLYRKLPHLKNTELIPAQAQDLLRKAYYKTVSRNARIYEEFKALAQILQAHNIPFITLKGICMAEWLYGDTGLRQMSDIDILIQEKDGVRCLDALHAAGYVSQQEFTVDEFVDSKSQNHYNPLFRNDVMVEIHIRLQNTREIYQQNLQEVWRDAVPVILNGMETLRLELSDMLIHAYLHLDKHFVTSHVQFTSFNDIVNLLRGIDNGQLTTDDGIKDNRQQTTDDGNHDNRQQTTDDGNHDNRQQTTDDGERLKIEEIEDFWERFEAKCIQYNFADTVFTYLILVKHYYKAQLPQYLADKYGPLIGFRRPLVPPLGDLKSEVYIRFERFLAGEDNAFIGRGAPRSNTEAHLRHLKQMNNPVDILRYVKGVVFPGKEFMISKYLRQRTTDNGQRKSDTSSYHHIITSKFWWLWYPYRWFTGLKGLWYVVTGNTTSSVANTEKKKEN